MLRRLKLWPFQLAIPVEPDSSLKNNNIAASTPRDAFAEDEEGEVPDETGKPELETLGGSDML